MPLRKARQYLSGGNWTAVGTVSTSNGLYVASGDSLRFVPVANFNGMPPGLTVRTADDSTNAVATGTRSIDVSNDTAKSGGTTRYSNNSNAVTLNTAITAINDAPTRSDATPVTLAAVAENIGLAAPGSTLSTSSVCLEKFVEYSIQESLAFCNWIQL